MQDLEAADPKGRLDVLGYRIAERIAKHVEEYYGLQGVWESLKPHVNKSMVKMLGGVDIPTEGKILMHIINASYKEPE